jgi:hypothetical protein
MKVDSIQVHLVYFKTHLSEAESNGPDFSLYSFVLSTVQLFKCIDSHRPGRFVLQNTFAREKEWP